MALFLLLIFFFFSCIPIFIASLSTVAISETSNQTLICALMVHPTTQKNFLNCTSFPGGIQIPANSYNFSFAGIVAGNEFLCALRLPSASSTSIMNCWRHSSNVNGTDMSYKRVYRGPEIYELDAGNSHICGLVKGTNRLECWQWSRFNSSKVQNFSNIAVGEDFVCGLSEARKIRCWGGNTKVVGLEPGGNYRLIAAGFRYACGVTLHNGLDCWGDMAGEKPQGKFISLALGESRGCALRPNWTVVCWGENKFKLPKGLQETHFTSIEAKKSVFCGVVSKNYSLFCWGNEILDSNYMVFEHVMPGPCRSQCPCGMLPGSGRLCEQGSICKPCVAVDVALPQPSEAPPPHSVQESKKNVLNQKLVAFLVVGCTGSLALVLVLCILIFRYCKSTNCCSSRVYDSGPLDKEEEACELPEQGPSQRVLEKRLSHLISIGSGGQLEEFSLQMMLDATNNFSEDYKIGTGSFGSVYRGTLQDGRQAAIKRAETSGAGRQEDNDSAFINELESLSRLNHKNLVKLFGFCEDYNELVLVYEYMNNGSLHDHLHNIHKSPLLMSWPARLQVALEAARGIEYLHIYAVPPIIHRDIKSSNILLDSKSAAKVSDFGLSLMSPENDESHLSLHAAGTIGYMDPEYFRLQQLTTKSDVYSFGVVLLELLSGYKAIHTNENEMPRNVVDLVIPYIFQDEIHKVLDPNVPAPTPFEIEAVAYVGCIAADCVTFEGRDRPSMTEIVCGLENALEACRVNRTTLSRSTTESYV